MADQNQIDEKTRAELAARGLVLVSRQDAQLSSNCLMFGFVLSLVAGFVGTYHFGIDHNAYFTILPLIIAAGLLPSAIGALRRKSWKKFFGLSALSLIPVLMVAFMLGSIHALVISNDFGATKSMDTFVQSDFAKYEDGKTGLISSVRLAAVVSEQDALRRDTTRLESLKSQFGDLSALSPAARERILNEVQVAKDSLAAKMLPEEEYRRLQIVNQTVYRVGSVSGTSVKTAGQDATPDYSVSRAQLSDNVAKLEAKYPLWTRILRKLTLI